MSVKTTRIGDKYYPEFNWRAIYNDNTFLNQYRKDGTANGYGNIDRTKLKSFEMYNTKDNKSILKLDLEPGQRLIARRRTWQDLNTNEIIGYVWLIGWQKTINGKNKQTVYHILPDGKIEKHGKWFGGQPELRSDEK
jgi:hypothetical protein